jgi:hypothetical protein
MKPAFALDFRDETISLLHRSGSGWQIVGSVPLDAPDLTEALGYLRATALGLSPRGLTTKLIIPNDQILYTEAFAPGPDAVTRAQQVEASLEGLTPYDVADLAYDISGDGPNVKVAVIAKETLAEAEAFAVEHRFNPISFAAAPDTASFDGEAWFGATALAPSLLAAGEVVEADFAATEAVARRFAAEPINDVVFADTAVKEPEADWAEEPVYGDVAVNAELSEAIPEFVEDETPASPVFDQDEVAVESAEVETFASDPIVEETFGEIYAAEVEVAPSEDVLADEVFADNAPADDRLDEDHRTDHDLIAALADTLAVPIEQPVPPLPDPAPIRLLPEVEEAPMALDVADDEPEDEPQGAGVIKAALSAQAKAAVPPVEKTLSDTARRVIDTALDDELPPLPSDAARLAFASRRQEDDAPNAAPALGAAKGGVVRPASAKPLAASAPRGAAKHAASEKATKAGKSALRGLSSLVNSATAKPRSKVSIPSALPPLRTPDGATRPQSNQTTAQRPATARPNGGFPTRPAVRGKPRYLGIIMTVVLLFLLAMIAAWSSYSLGAWNFGAQDPVQVVVADPTADIVDETPTTEDEMAADGEGAEAIVDPEQQLAAAPDTRAPLVAEPINPTAGTNDEIMLATMDAPPIAPDPLSLPQPAARGDPLPSAQPAPPPFGTVYKFAANGTIEPTPKGIITPEGVLLRAGKPSVVPAVRPASVISAFAAARPTATAPLTDPATTLTPAVYADPALAGKKPLPRPEGLSSPAAEQGSLAPAVDSRFANLRPKPRPDTILSAGRAAQQASAGASLTAQAEADTQEAVLTGGSKLAIAISRRPAARPHDLSRAVEAAVAAAVRNPKPEPEPEVAAKTEPEPDVAAAKPGKDAVAEADSEPEVASAAPKIPTKATVAKQATFKNAINLSKINLIGVYGSPSNRYALVRTAAGRYKKVKVGDTIDGGGRVAAITNSEVRYQKGGRLIALQMPKG